MTPKELKNITSRYHVLYVEDDAALRHASARLFSQFFGTIDEAVDGKQGLQMFEQNSYDLVISDINMPHMSGVEMIRRIKTLEPDQAVVVTSAYSDSQSLMELIEAGVDKFILKPLDLKKLISAFIQISFYIEDLKNKNSAKDQIKILKREIERLKSLLPPEDPRVSADDEKTLEQMENKLLQVIFDIQMEGECPTHLHEELLGLLRLLAEMLHSYRELKPLYLSIQALLSEMSQNLQCFCTKLTQVTQYFEDTIHCITGTRISNFTPSETERTVKSIEKIRQLLQA